MVEQVVGLRFVVEGEREAKRALKEVSDNQSKLTRDILRGADQVKSLSREWDKANRYLQEGTINTKAHAQAQIRLAREYALLNGYLKSNGALNTQRALAEMRAAQATRDAAAAEAAATAQRNRAQQSYNQLLAAMNPTIAMQQRMKQGHDTIRAALAAGIITRAQAAQSLRDYRNALRESNLAGNRAALGMNRLGLVTQQAGYQIGDFLVQVQSGTNVMVALGQQLTQLVGVFAMMARTTKMIAIFSGIGIIVPILTAIGAAYMRTKEAAESAAGGIKTLEDQMNSARESMRGLSDQIEIMNLGLKDTQELAFVRAISVAEENVAKAERALANAARARGGQDAPFAVPEKERQLEIAKELLKNAKDELQEYIRTRAEVELRNALEEQRVQSIKLYYDNLEAVAKLEKENADAANEIVKTRDDEIARLQNQIIMNETILKYGKDSQQVAILKASNEREAYRQQMMQAGILGNNLKTVMLLYDQNVKVKDEVVAATEKARETAKALEKQLELEKEISEAAAKRNKEFADRKISLENEIRILRLTLRYGEDSVQVQKELNLQARARLITEMMADGQSADRIVAMLNLLKIHQELTAEVDKMKDSTDDLLDIVEQITGVDLKKAFYDAATSVSTMNSRLDLTMTKIQGILGAIGSIGFETVATEAQTRALREGMSVAQSRIEGQIAQQRAELEAAGEPETFIGLAETGLRSALEADMRAQEELQRELSDPRRQAPPRRPFDIEYPEPDTAGGGAGQGAFLSRFPELQRAYKQAQEDAQAYNEEVQILDSALKAGKISQQEYNSYLSQAQEVYGQASTAALQYENALLQMANTTSQAMSDAMMSIVDGTKSAKDAFSDMVRIIIKKAFEMAVINPILNAIFGGVSGYVAAPSFFGAPAAAAANGAAFQSGNVVPFANGGVVGGPATFPMSGGRTGLMGEAGPEAIMPLKRGKDGKLGVVAEGGGVTVHNHFNISANGDESVKRIVQQQIPRIAEVTKAAVADSKRRGGSYARALA